MGNVIAALLIKVLCYCIDKAITGEYGIYIFGSMFILIVLFLIYEAISNICKRIIKTICLVFEKIGIVLYTLLFIIGDALYDVCISIKNIRIN